ncbi:transposon Tf2-8 polyprotein [Trichonephila clavipes]|nr:transposon Tf2-8 polyprotein [Trichonephila clavipes]
MPSRIFQTTFREVGISVSVEMHKNASAKQGHIKNYNKQLHSELPTTMNLNPEQVSIFVSTFFPMCTVEEYVEFILPYPTWFNNLKDNCGRCKQHSRTLRGSFMAPRKPHVLTLEQSRFLPKVAEQQYLLSEFFKGSKGKKDLNWSSEAITAFQRCKQALADAALLAHPSPSTPLALHVDASDYAIGGALHQVVDSELQPLAFFSRKLTSSEKSYSAYDRELLTIYSAIRHFRCMLEARDFTVFTDHKPLTYAFRQKSDKCSPRQIRQLDFISQFTTNIVHIPGSDNIAADVLSCFCNHLPKSN